MLSFRVWRPGGPRGEPAAVVAVARKGKEVGREVEEEEEEEDERERVRGTMLCKEAEAEEGGREDVVEDDPPLTNPSLPPFTPLVIFHRCCWCCCCCCCNCNSSTEGTL